MGPKIGDTSNIRVLTYNILADCYTRQAWFPYCSPENLEFFNRGNKVIAELKATSADILCLQGILL